MESIFKTQYLVLYIPDIRFCGPHCFIRDSGIVQRSFTQLEAKGKCSTASIMDLDPRAQWPAGAKVAGNIYAAKNIKGQLLKLSGGGININGRQNYLILDRKGNVLGQSDMQLSNAITNMCQ